MEYLAQPENSVARILLERRYGRANVLRLVVNYEEEQLNKQWLEASTSSCPGCNVRVEKSLGCNHVCHRFPSCLLISYSIQMTCSKCSTHFCYRCGERLSPKSPYVHFTTPGMHICILNFLIFSLGVECYEKLFEN